MKIMVTGGAGFIGSHVVDACIEAGHSVSIVDDLSTGKRKNVNPKARLHVVDIRDQESLESVFAEERPEVVSHQAARANVRESMIEPKLYADVNIMGSLSLLEAARKYECRKIIYASTGGAVYGEPVYVPVDEQHPVQPLDPYGASKHHVEHYLYIYRKHYGLDYTILRYPNVYGPRQDPYGEAGVVAIFAAHMLNGGQVLINGTGEQQRDFVYVGDVARANLLAVDAGGGEIFNIGSGVGTSVNEIFRELKCLADSDCAEAHDEAKLGEVYRTFLNADKARAGLGWEPQVTVIEGLARTVAYYRS